MGNDGCDEWDNCRGFSKPLPQGVQHAHSKTFKAIGNSPSERALLREKPQPEIDRKRRRALIAICACTTLMLLEAIGGMLAGSLALIVDAAHMLADVASYFVLLIALQAATKRPSE